MRFVGKLLTLGSVFLACGFTLALNADASITRTTMTCEFPGMSAFTYTEIFGEPAQFGWADSERIPSECVLNDRTPKRKSSVLSTRLHIGPNCTLLLPASILTSTRGRDTEDGFNLPAVLRTLSPPKTGRCRFDLRVKTASPHRHQEQSEARANRRRIRLWPAQKEGGAASGGNQ